MSTSTTTTTSASSDGTVTTETVTVAEPPLAPMAAPAHAAPSSKGHLIYFDGIGGRTFTLMNLDAIVLLTRINSVLLIR